MPFARSRVSFRFAPCWWSPFPNSFGSDGKWRPLVRRLIVAIRYLREQNIPILHNYKFVRGEDTFQFSDVEQGDQVLGTVQTK